ncbi:M24 family metallopeptidase [Streptomyces xanthochromogenes]|uniref:M24 family metallopeptidase n=1 Tax=Streptomyces xanthochromogenes TaxID=67384 RepID=UPI00344A91C4
MAVPDRMDEQLRALGLVEGQRAARALFSEVTARGLIAPGWLESEVADRIRELAREMSPRVPRRPLPVVRSGPQCVLPGGQEPTDDRVIEPDDLVIADLGPMFAGYGTAFARTAVAGQDPDRLRLLDDLPRVFTAVREAFRAELPMTGAALYAEARTLATKAGWTLGGWHAGRLTDATPPARADSVRAEAWISPDNDRPLRRTTDEGHQAHWVLEIHLVDEHRGFGGAYTGLLDLA